MDGVTITFLIVISILFILFIVEQISLLVSHTDSFKHPLSKLVASPFRKIGDGLRTDKKFTLIWSGVCLALFIASYCFGRYGNGEAFNVLMY